ncbi:mitogen-activated protein kinase kinase kinase [Saccharomycopsis crataegensis]|uniref:Mitogen-activated protein kinase kinase kinase n=1 Tax=Saccharomycopsis crataegensis TaxID=43959 RepID=A0AAV5QWK5_9ASCO|nr:mitogen-activated protein kinase kinase kinase [Saccharomycopsis crataegensis]
MSSPTRNEEKHQDVSEDNHAHQKSESNQSKTIKLDTYSTEKKPNLLRSHSLYSPLSPKFGSSDNHALGFSHEFSNAPQSAVANTSPTSNVHLPGSAKLQRFPSSKQNEIMRKNSSSRYPKKTSSISSNASTISSPSSPSSTTSTNSILHHHHHHPSTTTMQRQSSEQYKVRYKVQEKAYIKKMNNEYTDDYATKAIDTNKNYLDIMESDSEGEFESDFPFDDSEIDDEYEVMDSTLKRSSTLPDTPYGSSESQTMENTPPNRYSEQQNTLHMQQQLFNKEYLEPNSPSFGGTEEKTSPAQLSMHSPPSVPTAALTLSNAHGRMDKIVSDLDNNLPLPEAQFSDNEAAGQLLLTTDNTDLIRPSAFVGKPKTLADFETITGEPDNEFQKIFGDADAEDEEDLNITYATEISRINADKVNEAFQIDDSIIYPLIKSKLKPGLLEDQKFLERFEWQAMLGVVVKSDIVNDEKNKMLKKLNFGANEENTNIVNAHGESVSSSMFIIQCKKDVWLSLKAKRFGHTESEQREILSFSRSLMDEVIEEILNFKYDEKPLEKIFYSTLIIEGHFDDSVDLSILEKENYKEILQLTAQQTHKLNAMLYEDAGAVVQALLDKYDNCEQLWMSHEEMEAAKPIIKTEGFARKLEAMISWRNIISALYFEKSTLINWFKSETIYRSNDNSGRGDSRSSLSSNQFSQEFNHRHSSSSKSSISRHNNFDESQQEQSNSEDGSNRTGSLSPTIANESVISDGDDGMQYSSDQEVAKFHDINELDASWFAENILAYKNLSEVVDKKLFSVINPWTRKAKESYVSSKEIYQESNLPSFLPILLELVKFPSNLMKEVLGIRLQYAKNVSQQTLLGIDQTIYDFKVIIKLCFQVKENLFKFLNGVPDINLEYLEIDYEEQDNLLLDFTDYLLVLLHRKLLDSSRSIYSFTTYEEPEILGRQWDFLKNIGYFLEINSGFKVSRNFLFLTCRLCVRLLNYLEHQLDNPQLNVKLKFIKWYTTTFDNFSNLKRQLTKLTNSALRMVQNSLILHLNFNKDYQIAKALIHYFHKENHVMIAINGNENLHDILYNKGKPQEETNGARASRKNLRVYVFGTEDLLDVPEKEIIGSLQGSKLGADIEKPSLDALVVGTEGAQVLEYTTNEGGKPNKHFMASTIYSGHTSPSTSEVESVSTVDKDSITKSYNEEKRFHNVPYLIVLPVIRKIPWEGKVRNIVIQGDKKSTFPKLVSARYGNALLIAHGSPLNLPAAKTTLINNMKKHYVEEINVSSESLSETASPRHSIDAAVKMFDRLALEDDEESIKEGTNTPQVSDLLLDKKIVKLIKTLRTEKTCSLLQIQKELVRINKNFNRMSFVCLKKGLVLKDQILELMAREREPDQSCLEILNNLFYVIRDTSLSSLRNIEADEVGEFMNLMIELSIEWIKVVVDDCASKEKKTFRWCVSALEFALLVFQKFNILLLTDEQFKILKTKVAGCLSLLISHFDIMGARSNKADRVLLSYSKLQKKVIQRESTLALHKNSELNEKIIQLDNQLTEKLRKYKEVGKVLDDRKSENKFLTYLSSSFFKFSSKWQKGDYLGGGTFGSVYKATNLTNGNVMAVKEVKFPNSQSVANIGKVIKDEMTVLEMLEHPNIVHYFGVEVHSDKVYLFMEFCELGSLGFLLRQGRIDEMMTKWYTLQMVEGLAYLHSNNIAHRDIKPENILLNRLGVIKFVDFGAAKVIAASGRTRAMTATLPGQAGVTGTPMYMSPESITGHGNDVLGSSDVWALGCCVLEMATGRRPWAKLDNEFAIMYHIANGNKPQLPEEGELSEEGINFLNRCFETKPESRAKAAELINDPWLAETKALHATGYESSASSDIMEFA